jgi:sugar phosphate isomerase/epimerase
MTDLICSYYTTAGVSPVEGGSSSRPFEERVRACAEAGYVGIGIHVRDYRALRAAGATDDDLTAIVRDHGMRHVEVEFLLNWFADGDAGEAARRDEALMYHMVRTFDARVMFLGGDMTPGNPMSFDELIERFTVVAARAAEEGVTLGVEPCAWTNVGDIDDGLRLIRGSGADNVGLFLDVWHVYRRGLPYDVIRDLDPDLVAGVQIGDVGAEIHGTLAEDCLDHRLLPGEGVAQPAEFLVALDDVGVDVPISVEVLSVEQRARPSDEAADVSFRAARAVLEDAARR